jgi:endo-1,4-beta-xylanase
MDRRNFLKFSSGLTLAATLSAQDRMAHDRPDRDHDRAVPPSRPLKSYVAGCGMTLGIQTSKRQLQDPRQADFIVSNFNLIAAGNEFKWPKIQPGPDIYHFDEADWIINFVQQHHMLFHGHNLCWNTSNPKWFADTLNKSNAEKFLTDHINAVMKRYAGKVSSWDVVNEPVAVFDKRPDGLYPGPWVDLLGERYIDVAFHAAAEADPHAIRVLNLHHVEQDTEDGNHSREVALGLIQRLMKRNVPLQAIGFESHLEGSLSAHSASRDQFIREIRSLGLQLFITELDINDTRVQGDIEARDRKIGQTYYDYITDVVSAGDVKRLILFSISDMGNWYDALSDEHAKQFMRGDNTKHRPNILDENLRPKPELASVASALQRVCSSPRT